MPEEGADTALFNLEYRDLYAFFDLVINFPPKYCQRMVVDAVFLQQGKKEERNKDDATVSDNSHKKISDRQDFKLLMKERHAMLHAQQELSESSTSSFYQQSTFLHVKAPSFAIPWSDFAIQDLYPVEMLSFQYFLYLLDLHVPNWTANHIAGTYRVARGLAALHGIPPPVMIKCLLAIHCWPLRTSFFTEIARVLCEREKIAGKVVLSEHPLRDALKEYFPDLSSVSVSTFFFKIIII